MPYAGARGTARRRRGPLIVVSVVVVLLVLAAGSALYLLADGDEPPPVAAPTSAAPSRAADPDVPAPTAPTAPATAAAPESSADPRFAKVGQCVRHDGTANGKPKLLIAGCAANTYEVLRRFDGTTSGEKDAETKCAQVQGYTNWYFYDSELDTLDFVLCLKQQ
ncbi:LppU/SCO3897 family protein [Micromonospora musae]|uniref:LppU/SCO3897 family protein n=1 Tax=Micromonospora musae TaxID=1894970 RepID=UPI0034133308